MDTRRLLLGDWTPILRDGIDVLRLTLACGAVAFMLTGDAAAAAILGAIFTLTVAARLVNLPRVYDLAFVLAMSLQGWGEAFGAYDTVAWFDRLTHVLIPLLAAPVVAIALARLDVVPDPRDDTSGDLLADTVGALVGAALLVAWARFGWGSVRRIPGENRHEDTEAPSPV